MSRHTPRITPRGASTKLCARGVGRSGGNVTDVTAWTARLLDPKERRVDRIAVATLAYFSRMSRLAPTDGVERGQQRTGGPSGARVPRQLRVGARSRPDAAGVAFVGCGWLSIEKMLKMCFR